MANPFQPLPSPQGAALQLSDGWTVGDLIGVSWNVLKSQPGPMAWSAFRLFFLPFLVTLPVQLLAMVPMIFLMRQGSAVGLLTGLMVVIGLVGLGLWFGVSGYCLLGFLRVVLMAVRGQEINLNIQQIAGEGRVAGLGVLGWWMGRLMAGYLAGAVVMVPAIMFASQSLGEPPVWLFGGMVLAMPLMFGGVGWSFWRGLNELTAPLIATQEGMRSGEAMREAERRMDGSKMNFFAAYMVVSMVGGGGLAMVHIFTFGLGFPIVMVGQLVMFMLTFIQIVLLYEYQYRGRNGG